MSKAAEQMLSDRAARDTAKASLDSRLAQVRGDLDARGVGGRIADAVVGEATDVALEAVDVADHHKRIVAGTLAAIVAWVLRKPIIRGGRIAGEAIRARWSRRRRWSARMKRQAKGWLR